MKRLKNKIDCFDGRAHIDGKHFKDCDMYFSYTNVKNAVDWLKHKIKKEVFPIKEHQRGDCHKIGVCLKAIDEAFEDVKQ
jgi:hypothetical protein